VQAWRERNPEGLCGPEMITNSNFVGYSIGSGTDRDNALKLSFNAPSKYEVDAARARS